MGRRARKKDSKWRRTTNRNCAELSSSLSRGAPFSVAGLAKEAMADFKAAWQRKSVTVRGTQWGQRDTAA
jgi:hypothetical protein